MSREKPQVDAASPREARHVLLVEPIGSGAPLVDACRMLGHRVTALGLDHGDRRLPASVSDRADRLVRVDSNDEAAVHAAVAALGQAEPIAAVVAGNEYYVPLVARLAAGLGLPGLDPERVQAVRDKHAMRARLRAAGVRVPEFACPASMDEVTALSPTLRYPVVLKPRAAAGSFHVTRVAEPAGLIAAYARAQAETHRELDHEIGAAMLVEGYLEPPEYSVEGVVAADGPVVLSITEKLLGPAPAFVEVGHIVEAPVDAQMRTHIEAYIAEVVAALDIRLGVFHAEVRFDGAGRPVLVEIGARLPGDRITDLIVAAGGLSMPELSIRAHLGETLQVAPRPCPGRAGIAFFLPPRADGWARVEGLGEVRALPGCRADSLACDPARRPGHVDDYRARVGSVMFRAADYETVRAGIAGAHAHVRFVP